MGGRYDSNRRGSILVSRLISRPVIVLAVLVALLSPSSALSSSSMLPDLVSFHPASIYVETRPGVSARVLRFSGGISNHGSAPFELRGVPEAGDRWSAFQCIAWSGPACERERELDAVAFAPQQVYCWSIDAIVQYQLRAVGPDGTSGEVVANSGSVARPVRDAFRDPDVEPRSPDELVPRRLHCLPVQQGLSPGWGMYYEGDDRYQSIDISSIADGIYHLEAIANPLGVFSETDHENNLIRVLIHIFDGGRRVETLD